MDDLNVKLANYNSRKGFHSFHSMHSYNKPALKKQNKKKTQYKAQNISHIKAEYFNK